MVARNNVNVGTLFRRIGLAALSFFVVWILYSTYAGNGGYWRLFSHSGSQQGEKVNVTVFYEVLCPDSRAFVLRQLFPTWEKVPEIMDINYRPFGKAHFKEEGDNYKFECQHGPTECLGNIVHNCAVKYVQSPLPYIKCMMANNYEPMKIGKQCAEMLDINWPVIERCADSKEGKELLAEVGRESLGVKPHLSFIPTVALNGDFSDQPMRLKNLLSTVCNAFNGHRPENCIQVV